MHYNLPGDWSMQIKRTEFIVSRLIIQDIPTDGPMYRVKYDLVFLGVRYDRWRWFPELMWDKGHRIQAGVRRDQS
jgi:hypothetical protein